MRWVSPLLLFVTVLLPASGAGAAPPSGDYLAESSPLRAFDEAPMLVVTFLGAECPLARLYAARLNELADRYRAKGVDFVAVDGNAHDTPTLGAELQACLRFPVVEDRRQQLVDSLGATRSPETFLLDRDRQVVYQGRIDDQYAPGVHGRSSPTRDDLEAAIQESLAGRKVSVPYTEAQGCIIDRWPTNSIASESDRETPAPTYAESVASILDRHCVECHRAGAGAPFSLATYDEAVAWRETIREVIAQKRMPPWGAEGGDFANDRSLSDGDRHTLNDWLDAGCPAGDMSRRPASPKFDDDAWSIRADRVVSMPHEFDVPTQGVLDYQEFAIDPGFAADTWVNAVEIRPGCRDVVHHINVYVKPKGTPAGQLVVNPLGDYYLAMAVPGNCATVMPPGTAKLIPRGWQIVMEVHYVPNGVARRDRSSVALQVCEASQVRQELATRALLDDHLAIEPFARKQVAHSFTCEDDFTLSALYPHMHLRGRSMVFEARYPDGRQEVLLNVSRYDFAWQHRYVLRTPKSLPRGTVVTATAMYDNTADNPNNPDPAAYVHAGRQTTDEMFQACFEICRTHEDRLAAGRNWPPAIGWLVVGLAVAAGVHRAVLARRVSGRRESRQLADSVAG